jgi:hypothetical protein
MLPVQTNANTVINENKPSDATEVPIIIESNTVLILILWFSIHRNFAGLDEETLLR